jgi:hypothetical protein
MVVDYRGKVVPALMINIATDTVIATVLRGKLDVRCGGHLGQQQGVVANVKDGLGDRHVDQPNNRNDPRRGWHIRRGSDPTAATSREHRERDRQVGLGHLHIANAVTSFISQAVVRRPVWHLRHSA